jgi:hypothetical protein
MKKNILLLLGLFVSVTFYAQEKPEKEEGHTNQNKFRQLYQEFATPNQYRTASGAPGPAYYQNTADYKMDIILKEDTKEIFGEETITYTNNSPNPLEYLWVQLDQNVRKKDSPSKERNGGGYSPLMRPSSVVSEYMSKEEFDGGFNIREVSKDGKPLPYYINQTMMRVEMPEDLQPGDSFSFYIKWDYKINDRIADGGRSGYEFFEKDGNIAFIIAQFFPRMAVYNDVEGWQNYQFWGSGEFALPFGDYEVNITVPADHIVEATGNLENRKKIYSKTMMERYEQAKKSFDKPVMIVTEEEAIENEKEKSTKTKTWSYKADMVRDFAFTASRKYILDMMNVRVGNKTVMAVSAYPKEGNPLWEEWSTVAVAETLKTYSKFTFEYPYHKAVSVHGKSIGMEYPMICFNFGRPNEDGTYSDRTKYGMIGVIIHEVGHNYFPMIVNSDERQWGWMDEGINSFVQFLTEQQMGVDFPSLLDETGVYPSRRGFPYKIVDYMKGSQDFIAPIMSNPEQVYQLGNNAYGKPATALNILRETIMEPEKFDYAFKTFAQRWMFKHPTPEDFFRTMEDASAVDLDWFWRGWFYTTDYVDIGIEEVKTYKLTDKITDSAREYLKRFGITDPENNPNLQGLVYMIPADAENIEEYAPSKDNLENSQNLKSFLMDNFTDEERAEMGEMPEYFYEIKFNKPGGLVMPIIVEYTYEDGSKELKKYPVQVWRKNDNEVSKTITSNKKITNIQLDPKLETADIDVSNNTWPREEQKSEFEEFENSEK